ncbi:hypothetical protein R2F61_09145 [Mollicutes bacterium LVI A0078]|nr:hypothetical protein RZE84_08920 [Mollicutes bacterium LVI A0075]WOO90865.1 hypothetical protein R2F61_09145 [Mollicutes bacterium LVI A0078]
MKNPILLKINQSNINLDYEGLYLCVFINCQLTPKLTIELNKLSVNNKLKIFKADANKYSKPHLKKEQETIYKQIQNNEEPELLFYSNFDPKLSEYDNYLGLKSKLVVAKDIDQICQNLNDAYKTKSEHKFVIEFKTEGSEQMINDVTKLHQYINAMSVVYTDQKSKLFTCSNQLSDGDQIISKSSNDVKYSYFFIPRSNSYQLPQKVLLINSDNILNYTKYHMSKNYIVAPSQEIQESTYLNKMTNTYNITKLEQLNVGDHLFYNQNIQPKVIISLVEDFNNLEICTLENNKEVVVTELIKNTEAYNQFILCYKTDLYNNHYNPISDMIK